MNPANPDRVPADLRAQLVMPLVPIPVDGDYSQVNNAPTQLFPCTLTPNDTLVIHSPLREINQEEHGGSMNRPTGNIHTI